MKIDQDVKDPEQAVGRKVCKALVRRRRVRALVPGDADKLSRRTLVGQCRPGGRLDDVEQPGSARWWQEEARSIALRSSLTRPSWSK